MKKGYKLSSIHELYIWISRYGTAPAENLKLKIGDKKWTFKRKEKTMFHINQVQCNKTWINKREKKRMKAQNKNLKKQQHKVEETIKNWERKFPEEKTI